MFGPIYTQHQPVRLAVLFPTLDFGSATMPTQRSSLTLQQATGTQGGGGNTPLAQLVAQGHIAAPGPGVYTPLNPTFGVQNPSSQWSQPITQPSAPQTTSQPTRQTNQDINPYSTTPYAPTLNQPKQTATTLASAPTLMPSGRNNPYYTPGASRQSDSYYKSIGQSPPRGQRRWLMFIITTGKRLDPETI